jgi:signal transduction histidine kinase
VLLILAGQLAVVAMIAVAEPSEVAYWTYYIGLILIILWAGFIFKLSTAEVILASVTNVVFYNIVAIFFQGMFNYSIGTNEFSHFFANNFFLITSSLCAIVGAGQLNSFSNRLMAQNKMLERDKRKLVEAKHKAEESDMLKSAFLANMSHEIRTPVNAILGFSELLKRHKVDKEKEGKYLSIIQSKSNQLVQLIDDIIDVSKIEANQIQINLHPVSLQRLFEDLSLLYAGILVKKEKTEQLKIFVNEPKSYFSEKVLIDETRFTQVVTNLVNNAIKFTENGTIEIGYKMYDLKNFMVYVKDTGVGIPEESKNLIFERFRQSDESIADNYGGTGLGLSIAKSLVELMGGKIWLESSSKEGSKFCFTIPYKEADSNSEIIDFSDFEHSYDWSGKSILIVEDEPTNMEFLKVLLNETKATLLFAENGKEAVSVVDHNKVDAIVMDLKMPVMNGYEASQKIKSKHKKLPIIAQTAYAMQYDESKALNMGLDAYIKKPIDEKKLFPVLSSYLD